MQPVQPAIYAPLTCGCASIRPSCQQSSRTATHREQAVRDRPAGPFQAALLRKVCVPRPHHILFLAVLFIPPAPWAPTRPPLRQTASPTPSDKQLLYSGGAAEPGLELGPAHTAVPGVIRNLASNMSKSSSRRPKVASTCPAAEIRDGCGRKAPPHAVSAAGTRPSWHHPFGSRTQGPPTLAQSTPVR